jgi:biotin carboxyl carrier protein
MIARPDSGSAQAHDVAEVNGTWSLLIGDGPCRRSYEVAFSEAAGQLTVHVNGMPVPGDLPLTPGARGRRRAVAGQGAADNSNGPVSVVAPMPGRVVKVLVSAGDAVAARQGLVVIEAMKMENELRAPRAGTVKDVRVAAGAPVEAGSVVVVIE